MTGTAETRWKYAFFLLPLLYFAVFGTLGFHDTDAGFIPGLSWRILMDGRIYEDFTYVRPPLSPLFHAAVMRVLPFSFEIAGERLLFYLMMAVIAFAAASAINSCFDLNRWGTGKWSLAVIGFLFNVHNFPPMPWHTVDGIFFAAGGAWFLIFSKDRGAAFLVPGMVLLTLAAMCKQSFFVMPFAGILTLWIRNGKLHAAAGAITFIATTGVFILSGILSLQVLQQLLQAGQPGELFASGFKEYFKGIFVMGIPALVLWLLSGQNEFGPRTRSLLVMLMWAIPFLLAAGTMVWSVYKGQFRMPAFGYSQGIFLAGLLYPLLYGKNHPKESMALLFLMSIAWCAGISWGYATPMLFILPSLASLLALSAEMQRKGMGRRTLTYGTVIFGVIFFCTSFITYRDAPAWKCSHPLGELFPQAGHIRTGDENFNKHSEFKQLLREYGKDFVVFPGFPHAYYFAQTPAFFATDWEHDAEIRWKDDSTRLKNLLEKNIRFAWLEKGKDAEIYSGTNYGSAISAHVARNWKVIHEGKYFLICTNPSRP